MIPQDIATVRVSDKIMTANKLRNYLWKEENQPRLKKNLVNSWYSYLIGKCDEDF